MENPLLAAICPWCGSVEPPFAGGFCPGCRQSREAVDASAYCEVHQGPVSDAATVVLAPARTLVLTPEPTLVAHGQLCPACGSALAAPPKTAAVVVVRRRRRWPRRTLEVVLGVAVVGGLVLYGADRTGDLAVPHTSATHTSPPVTHVATPAPPTPRTAISRYYGYDVGPCLMLYSGEGGDTYVCGSGDVATIDPSGQVHVPHLWW